VSIAATAIKQQIVTLMKANSAHNSVNLFLKGTPYKVPTQYYPICIVAIVSESTVGRMTGNKHEREYAGIIEFETLIQDIWMSSISNREVVVPSAATIDTLVQATIALFKTTSNQRLGNLSVTGGAVDEFIIGEQAEYGVEPSVDRPDSLNNFATIPFVCRTLETFS